MIRTTVARGTFFVRLRVQSDGTWVGQVEQIPSGWKEQFHCRQELLEQLAQMVTGPAPDLESPESPRGA
jgi:hypothetical protein